MVYDVNKHEHNNKHVFTLNKHGLNLFWDRLKVINKIWVHQLVLQNIFCSTNKMGILVVTLFVET